MLRKFDSLRQWSLLLFFSTVCVVQALPEEKTVSMQIDFVAWGDDIKNLSCGKSHDRKQFDALAFRYSEPIDYRGPAVLELHRSASSGANDADEATREQALRDQQALQNPSAKQKPSPQSKSPQSAQHNTIVDKKSALHRELEKRRETEPTLLALIPLPPAVRRVTILLTPLTAELYRGFVINDDPSKLPFGKIRIHNLSSNLIGIQQQGKKLIELPSGTFAMAEPIRGQFVYELSYREGKNRRIQENNLLRVPEREQCQMFIVESDHVFFQASDGTRNGKYQVVILRR